MLRNSGNLNFQANERYSGKGYGDPNNLEYGAIPEYTVAGTRAAYELSGYAGEVSVRADNLFGEDYFLNNFPNVGSGGAVPAHMASH